MKKFTLALLPVLALFLVSACEGMKEDAKDTPIGSVVSGKTRHTEDYVDKVKERNKAEDRDVWRPANTGIDGF